MDLKSRIDEGRIMEGWLYVIRSNNIGIKYSRKLYFVLQHRHFKSFKSISHSYIKDPIRSEVIESNIRVMDNGRKSIRGKVYFIFTLCDTSSYDDHVKLGASNQEEAARWIKSFQELLFLKANQNPGNFLDSVRSSFSGRVCDTNDVDNFLSLASVTYPETADFCEPSYWTIFGCHNGLRLFKQARDKEGHNKPRDGHPALAAVSVIEGTPEVIFRTIMSLGSSRSQWDFCFQKGSVIENIDGHTDIIHKQLHGDWLPWGMKRRDFLLQRYWRREDDGSYIILYRSVLHNKCPPQKDVVRARIKGGGYVISPVNDYKQSVVRHMLAIDWKLWRSYLQKSFSRCLTIRMLERLAALREFFKTSDSLLHQSEMCVSVRDQSKGKEEHKERAEGGLAKALSDRLNRVETDHGSDEFFEFDEPLFNDQSGNRWDGDNGHEIYSQDISCMKSYASPTNVIVEKKHEYIVQRKGCADEEIMWEECVPCNYTGNLPEDQTGNLPNSWSVPEPSIFQIRGETFLEDGKKIPAESTLLQTVAMDWLRSDKREDDLASRPGNIVQKYAIDGRPEFFFVVNFQVPGSTTYNLVLYCMTNTPIKDLPLLERFIEGDDAFRNSRFKLIPHVTKGPWIVKQTIRRAALVGHMLKINYIRGKNYMEIDIDVGSSAMARAAASTTFSYFSSLIIEMAFVIQANTQDELPEHLFGACRLNYLDICKACGTTTA